MEQKQRIFKIGATRIVADETMSQLDNEGIRKLLAPLYPQVEHATIREVEDEQQHLIEFLARPGRKG